MTAPTRRHVIAGSIAALGAAGAPAIAVAADPEEQMRNAVQELQDAIQARWPGREVRSWDQLNDTGDHVNPGIILVASEPRS